MLLTSLVGVAAPGWRIGPSLPTPRSTAASVLLADGRILLAGGDSASGSLSTAVVFDPLAVSWSSVPSMSVAKYPVTASILLSGRALVLGGFPGATVSDIFDPALNSWAAGPSRNFTDYFYSATLRSSGTVVISGGFNCEQYLPTPNTITPIPCHTNLQYGVSVLLSDGRVAHLLGRDSAMQETGSVTVLSVDGGVWVAGANGPMRAQHSTGTVLPSGDVLVAGGITDAGGQFIATAALYTVTSNSWRLAPAMNAPRSGHSAVALADGRVLVAGGYDLAQELRSTEVYDEGTGSWADAGLFNQSRAGANLAILPDGRPFVLGGYGQGPIAARQKC